MANAIRPPVNLSTSVWNAMVTIQRSSAAGSDLGHTIGPTGPPATLRPTGAPFEGGGAVAVAEADSTSFEHMHHHNLRQATELDIPYIGDSCSPPSIQPPYEYGQAQYDCPIIYRNSRTQNSIVNEVTVNTFRLTTCTESSSTTTLVFPHGTLDLQTHYQYTADLLALERCCHLVANTPTLLLQNRYTTTG